MASSESSGTNMFQRGFKISGSKILELYKFVMLKNRGYSGDEIVVEVKKAIAPGTGLHTYMDLNLNLNLDNIRVFEKLPERELMNYINYVRRLMRMHQDFC